MTTFNNALALRATPVRTIVVFIWLAAIAVGLLFHL
jgi:hypothetical protein